MIRDSYKFNRELAKTGEFGQIPMLGLQRKYREMGIETPQGIESACAQVVLLFFSFQRDGHNEFSSFQVYSIFVRRKEKG